MTSRIFGPGFFLCSACAVAFPPAVMAQGTPAANAAGEAAASTQGLTEIVVTAQRREENAQRLALPIQVLGGDELVRANITSPEDFNKLTAGVTFTSGGNVPQVFIRGVGNFAGNSLAEGAVAFNFDGVYVSRGPSVRGMFYDLERVEILKGPQGTLYGRNATGGALNIITAKPKLGQTSGYVEFQGGDYSDKEGNAALNIPLGQTVALRASGQIIEHDGYLTDGYDDEKSQSARIHLLWEPSGDVSLLLSGNYQHLEGMGAGGAAVPQLPGDEWRGTADPAVTAIIQGQPFIGGLLTYPKTDGFVDMTLYAATAELNWDVGFATLTVLPAYRKMENDDLNYVPGFSVTHRERAEQTSVEARLANGNEFLNWVVGGYYFDESQQNPDGVPEQFVEQGLSTFVANFQHWTTRSSAAFAQLTFSLTEQLRLTGGLRYTEERKVYEDQFDNYSLPLQPPAPPGTCVAPGFFDPTTPYPPRFCHLISDTRGANAQHLDDDSVTYKAGLEYDLAPQSMAYLNVSTGFKSGGFFLSPPPNTFKPEELTAFEVGSKNRFLDNRLQLNFEAFYWIYRDHQESSVGPTSVPGFFTLLTYNSEEATSYGVGMDTIFLATPADELRFSAEYNKTNYESFSFFYPSSVVGPPATGCNVAPPQGGGQVVDCSGLPLMRAREWSGTAGYSHEFNLDGNGSITASVSLQFSGPYFLSTDFLPSTEQGSYAIGDFDLTYTTADSHWTVTGFVHNIWDEAVYSQSFHYPYVSPANTLSGPDGLNIGRLRPPRTVGARIRFSF